jgi:hypothetical protein
MHVSDHGGQIEQLPNRSIMPPPATLLLHI